MTAPGPPGFPRNRPEAEGTHSLRRQKPDARNQTFGQISHISGAKLAFWSNFIFVRYHFSARKLENTLKLPSNIVWRPKTTFFSLTYFWRKYSFPELFPLFKGPGRAHALFKGPGQVHKGLYGPIWAHISDFWFNFVHFGFKIDFLTKFLDDSAWFCVEKLKKHGFETKKLKN